MYFETGRKKESEFMKDNGNRSNGNGGNGGRKTKTSMWKKYRIYDSKYPNRPPEIPPELLNMISI
jgi:hypothetical protein